MTVCFLHSPLLRGAPAKYSFPLPSLHSGGRVLHAASRFTRRAARYHPKGTRTLFEEYYFLYIVVLCPSVVRPEVYLCLFLTFARFCISLRRH